MVGSTIKSLKAAINSVLFETDASAHVTKAVASAK
jgi:hypothetical protein